MIFYRVIREGFSDKVVFEQRPVMGDSQVDTWKNIPGRENSKYEHMLGLFQEQQECEGDHGRSR